MERSTWETAILVLMGSACIIGLAGVVNWLMTLEVIKWTRFLVTSLQELVTAQSHLVRDRGEVNLIIDEKITAGKVRHFRVGMRLCAVISLFWMVRHFLISMMGHQEPNPQQDLHLAACVYYFSLAFVWPGCVTPRTLDAHYCIMMALFSSSVLACAAEDLLKVQLFTNACMAILNAIRRTMPGKRLPLFLLLNVAFAGCFVGVTLTRGRQFWRIPIVAALLQALAIGLVCLVSLSLEVGFRSTTYRVLEQQEVQELHSAACAVLRSSCDVLVELDESGCFTDSATDLSSLLLRGVQPRCLQGVRLVDLFVEDAERELFASRLLESRLQKIGLAENMQVSMQDSCGNRLRLEMIWFQFRRLTGQRYVTVGMREVSDAALAPRSLHQEAPPPQGGEVTAVHRELTGTSSRSSGCMSIPEDMAVHSEQQSFPMLVLDAHGSGMPIQKVTAEFRAQVGRLPPRVPLVKYIRQPAHFLAWAQTSINDILTEEARHTDSECPVTLQMPTGQLVKAKVTMIPWEESGEDEADDNEKGKDRDTLMVGLAFLEVRKQSHSPRRLIHRSGEAGRSPGSLKFAACSKETLAL